MSKLDEPDSPANSRASSLSEFDSRVLRGKAGYAEVQKRTFTKWVNANLAKRGSKVDDLFVDLRDGTRLIELLEVISGDRLPRPDKGTGRFVMGGNVNKALSYIRSKAVLQNIGPEDIVDGNPALTLGMIWTVILRFQIQEIAVDKLLAKEALQLWCKKETEGYKGVAIENFHKSWVDGLAFCAVIHAHRPDLINFDALRREDAIQNLQKAFDVAEKRLGVAALLDAADVAVDMPDERSIITYVAALYHAFEAAQSANAADGAHGVDEEEHQRKRAAEEEEELQRNREDDERQRIRAEEAEEERKRADAELQRRREEEEVQRRREEEERQRHRDEEERRNREEEEEQRKRADEEERQRKRAEEEELQRKRAEEEERQRKRDEDERRKREEEELQHKRAEEEERQRKRAEEERRMREEEERQRRRAEEEELQRKRAEEEERQLKRAEEEERQRRRTEEEERQRKRDEEEQRKRDDEEKRRLEEAAAKSEDREKAQRDQRELEENRRKAQREREADEKAQREAVLRADDEAKAKARWEADVKPRLEKEAVLTAAMTEQAARERARRFADEKVPRMAHKQRRPSQANVAKGIARMAVDDRDEQEVATRAASKAKAEAADSYARKHVEERTKQEGIAVDSPRKDAETATRREGVQRNGSATSQFSWTDRVRNVPWARVMTARACLLVFLLVFLVVLLLSVDARS